jgi:hypothetical protein
MEAFLVTSSQSKVKRGVIMSVLPGGTKYAVRTKRSFPSTVSFWNIGTKS